ncbi:DUF305 domain-containing protein [Actinopolymorpha pittospori]|uniref:Uncharacterized protein (DUF305 family) n=1 Tax=Actinopolymorpha pittospori TaxID=648752 RepID=A0A927N3Q2_9ACTN|nr:uncharacterized protein (DUF305 family) [Actinopolymorpha pittospori]
MSRTAWLGALVIALLTAGCGAAGADTTVQLGGTTATAPAARTVERPWGTVAAFPELRQAEIPVAADRGFVADMLTHHRQAIELSENVLRHEGLDERVAATARYIAADQKNEIEVMTTWSRAWEESFRKYGHGAHAPAMHAAHDSSSMPGMVAPETVARVRTLPREEAQVEFLRLMVEHHEGAVTMSQDYLGTDHNSFTRTIAQHIIREQTTEITYMRRLADSLSGATPASGATPTPGAGAP